MGNAISSAYSGAASFGKAFSLMNAIAGTLIGIIFIVVGIVVIRQAKKYFTQGSTVTNVTCPNTNGTNPIGNCKVTCNSPTCKNITVSAPDGKYQIGDPIQLQCDKDQPCDCKIDTPQTLSMSLAGWLILGISICVIFMVWAQYYLTTQSKGYAAAVGVNDFVGMF